MACVVRSRRGRAESPNCAYFARVRADRAAMAFWRCCSGLFAVGAASRTRDTLQEASRGYTNVPLFGLIPVLRALVVAHRVDLGHPAGLPWQGPSLAVPPPLGPGWRSW